uniref:Sm domain-containing protein n=1 Tax=Schistocephalus solidus TaxID=70667 RepID=A0A0V0J610_SCHSO
MNSRQYPPPKHRKKSGNTLLDYWKSLEPDETGLRSLGPMGRLLTAMNKKSKVLVMTRGMREIRAILTGRLIAFDRFWNLILSEVTECSLKVDPSRLRSESGPGRRRRQRLRKARLCHKQPPNETEPPVSTPRFETASVYDSLAFMDPFIGEETLLPHLPPTPSPSAPLTQTPVDLAVQADPSAFEAPGASAWTPSVAEVIRSEGRGYTDAKWATVLTGQLFIRGANVVLVRILSD